jgi:membrane protease YdiL (CAAX protease family)
VNGADNGAESGAADSPESAAGQASSDSVQPSAAPAEPSAPPKIIKCPNCYKKIRDTVKFCPYCGRSREELDEYIDERREAHKANREVLHSSERLYKMAVFYAVLLGLNFLSAYVLPSETSWGMIVASFTIISVTGTWYLSSDSSTRITGSSVLTSRVALLPLTAFITYAITVTNNLIVSWALGLGELMEKSEGTDVFLESTLPLPVLILTICVVPGIFEELFFRGLVQSTCETAMSVREALWVQAIVFAIAHVNPIGFFTYLVFMGLYLGWLRNEYRSLIPGMLVHFTHNLLCVIQDRYQVLPLE